MKIWVYVEGESDRFALKALWQEWIAKLGQKGWGLKVIPLDDKSRYLRKIGSRVSEKLCGSDDDLVVGLLDLYPAYDVNNYRHRSMDELCQVQLQEVRKALRKDHGCNASQIDNLLSRFHPSALKHDLEMLLLAATDHLRTHLKTSEQLGGWRNPVEDQNMDSPPKRVVEDIFLRKSSKRKAYRDTKDASAVLRRVTDIRQVLYKDGQLQCPVFKNMLDWIGSRTGVAAYS